MNLPDFNLPTSLSCQRLFHGRGHTFPGLSHVCIDWYAPVVLITLYQEVETEWLDALNAAIQAQISQCTSIQVQYRCRSLAPVDVIWGENIETLHALEHGLKYHITLKANQNHGLFLDMANGREWILKQAKHKRVLNLFSYTCGFSVAAVAGKADFVMNLDMSKSALSQGRENHKLNSHDTSHVKFVGVDLFKSWGKLRRDPKFDIVVSDPPSFQKGSINVERDYKKIIKRIPEFMAPKGLLMLCLNSPDLTVDWLKAQVAEHCPDCKFVERLANPEVFIEADVNKALKVLIFSYNPV
ncbi:class I SAM-dependent methyltransferase [Algibacillus agarilyticus]|uniref:class I SAM-dependent methyltransferase n=1 Tax=Algibacillus agarilyticus TaxID=2234133 RepID=UPI000DCFC36E|nr:class I SAM-dependent methyltransferase [Algibacillus agarilyticus]